MTRVRSILLEVVATGPGDCPGAEAGGADRLEIVSGMESDGLTPLPSTVREVLETTQLPIRVMLRTRDDFAARAGEVDRLGDLVDDFAALGAHGFVFGFLRADGQIDLDAVAGLAQRVVLAGRVWTFHRAIDHAVDRDRAFGELQTLPGLTAVLTAGSGTGVRDGGADLLRRAGSTWGSRLLVGGGLLPEHVAGLARAGVRAFHIGSGARTTRRWSEPVAAEEVAKWRLLLDQQVAQTDSAS